MNIKNLLMKANSLIAELDPYLLRVVQLAKILNQNRSQKFRNDSSAFIEINDFCFDSNILEKYLSSLRDALNAATQNAENQISHFRKKRESLEYKFTLYKAIEILLQKTSNPRKIRYAMYSTYDESWEDVLEPSTLEILDEMDYGRSTSSKLYRNVEQVLADFNNEASPISEVDKNIKIYTILRDVIPQYTEEIDKRIKILRYLKKFV